MKALNLRSHDVERRLWHGTTLEATDGINMYGFNSRYCGENTKGIVVHMKLEMAELIFCEYLTILRLQFGYS